MAARQRSTPVALRDDYEDLSFREGMAKYYRENPPDFTVKKDVANRYGVGYFIAMLFLQYYIGGWIIIPHMIDGQELLLWRLFMTFIFAQVAYNWFQCCRKYVNKVEKRAEDSDKTEVVGWKLCAICQCYAPPRSHHCKLCKACIMRQDHHCFFAAGCIGHFTVAYFLFLSFWLLVSQISALYWIVSYTRVEFASGWMYVPPTALWACLTGNQPWFNFLIILFTFLILVNAFGAGFYLGVSTYAATDNVTFYEGSRGIRRYRKGSVLANLRAAWGGYYWIRWLIPFYVQPEGDGYEWNIGRHEQ